MQTSVMGFPRIGKLRELKFAEEKYFKNELSEEELFKVASILKKEHIKYQHQAGIDFISSNDFSLYDQMLDTAVMLNVIPQRYLKLKENSQINDTDVYFAMARGYQGEAGDVNALAMKKWFNTNYHYIVPEFEDDTNVTANTSKLTKEFEEALSDGIKTKPAIIGPFTFLKLSLSTGTKTPFDFTDDIVHAYIEVLADIQQAGAEWIQIEEPILVCDLTEEEKNVFAKIYKNIISAKKGLKLILSTYFGDVRDCWDTIMNLDFDGIGLDFVEGKRTMELLEENGFPSDKLLFAGLVNGKNIWKSDYEKVLDKTNKIKAFAKNIVVSTSCSLLHVPYTLEYESKLSPEVKQRLSFAVEKLKELKDIAYLAERKDIEKDPVFAGNKSNLAEAGVANDQRVRDRIKALSDGDFIRQPERKERKKIQADALKLPLFPTTTIGSFPQTKEVKENRSAFRKGEKDAKEYNKKIYEYIEDCIKLQEKTGLDILVHGEFERNDMVEFFGENLEGFVFTEKAWVQSYGTRCVKPPIIFGDVKRKKSITVEYIQFAQSLTDKYVKGMLTGPVTILNWSFPREDITLKESALQIALAIREEVSELENAGIKIIQIDEAALREKLPLRKEDWYCEYLDWAIPAFRLCHSGVNPETQIHTHMCYSEFGDIIKDIDNMDADVISFEASRSDLQILDSLAESNFKTQVGPGVYDIHSPRIPSTEEISEAIEKMIAKIGKEDLWINPDCGLKTRQVQEVEASLYNLTEAADKIRKKYL